jgi:hypothetical protein
LKGFVTNFVTTCIDRSIVAVPPPKNGVFQHAAIDFSTRFPSKTAGPNRKSAARNLTGGAWDGYFNKLLDRWYPAR